LPAGSVDTEEEAEQLLARTCQRVWIADEGRLGWLAPELEREQTLPNLYAFGARLEAEYQRMIAERNPGPKEDE
jgi:hypothetical protein